MKKWIVLGWMWVASSSGFAANLVTTSSPILKPEEITARVREKLSPIVQEALDKHCGEDCPSFKIEAQYKKSLAKDILEDLGFSPSEETTVQPELQSIQLSVLVHDKVPQASKDALKQILTHIANNESLVPAHVQLKTLNGMAPTLEKKAHPVEEPKVPEDHRMEAFRILIWPMSVIVMTLVGLIGLVLSLKNRRDLLRDQLLAKAPFTGLSTDPQGGKNEHANPAYPEALMLMESRKDDFLWLIENLSLQGDVKSLAKVVSIYTPQDLSEKLNFSKQTLKVLSSVNSNRQKVNAQEAFSWIKDSLDGVHWKRLEEQQFPLAMLARLSDKQRGQIFANVKSINEKAALLASIPEEKWPPLLSQISSEERIKVGVALSSHQESSLQDRIQLEGRLSAQVKEIMEKTTVYSESLMENFTLYLTEDEAQTLWQELSQQRAGQSSTKKPMMLSMDSLVQELEPVAATEIFTCLEIESLSALVHQLSDETKHKVFTSLPKTLRDRLNTMTQVPSDVQLMRARAQMLDAYRKFTSGSMMQ
jgi:hypothetical protein